MRQVQETNSADLRADVANIASGKPLPSSRKAAVYPAPLDDFRTQLNLLLQASLDLDYILNTFLEKLSLFVKVESMSFVDGGGKSLCELGKRRAHHCAYRINVQNEELGELLFSCSRRFEDQELSTLEQLIGALLFPLRNAIKYQEALASAQRDALTGIGNRAAFDQALQHEINVARRFGQPLSLAVIDIDHFKRINDSVGHARGDEVLVAAASAIDEVSRDTDKVFRFGGEEFVVLLPGTSIAGAFIISQRIRSHIEKHCAFGDLPDGQVTVSIGTACLHGDDAASALFKRADGALYQAKHSGRNCVVCSAADSAADTRGQSVLG